MIRNRDLGRSDRGLGRRLRWGAWALAAWGAGCAATPTTPPAISGPLPQSGAAPAAGPGIAKVAPTVSPAVLAAEVASLDAVLSDGWKAAGVVPGAISDDGEFIRRVTLDLVGRVPTLPELTAFVADRAPEKRVVLVDRLLVDPGFGIHLADVEGDLLFGSQREKRITSADPRTFLAAAFNDGRPYDQLAQALLTASGSDEQAGAAAFVITRKRGGGGPEAVAGAASRIFLGMQIQCAQCHDHPYDPRWKQKDFYGLVGYFARTKIRRVRAMDAAAATEGSSPMADATGVMADAMGDKRRRFFEVFDERRGEAKMHAPGATKDVVVQPGFLGRKLPERPGESRRQTFARAAIASDLFAKAFVGRQWRQLFGAAPLEPWDDLGAESDEKHTRLLVTLANGFRDTGHDVKRLFRRIVLSTAYARSATPSGQDDGGVAARAFARARVRPLTPEQLVSSLMVATGVDEMIRQRRPRGGAGGASGLSRAAWRERVGGDKRLTADANSGMAEPGMAADAPDPKVAAMEDPPASDSDRAGRLAERTLREYRFTFEDDEMADSDFDGTLPQALLLLNGDFLNNGVRAGKGGVLAGILADTPEIDGRVDRMFLAAYARLPRPEERAAFRAAVDVPRPQQQRAYEDAFFALLVSTEATTNH